MKLAASVGLLLMMVVVASPGSHAQENDVIRSRKLQRRGLSAFNDGNYRESISLFRNALALRPDFPTLQYDLAQLYALTGDVDSSIAWLRSVASMGLVYRAAADTVFRSLRNHPGFAEVMAEFERNKKPVVSSTPAFRVPLKGLLTEGIAYDPVGKQLFVGSVNKRQILRVNRDGTVTPFSRKGDKLWGVFGMAVDASRRILWACTSEIGQMEGYRKSGHDRSAIVKYDLNAGRLLARFPLTDTSTSHVLGDLAILPNGDVVATDSRSPQIVAVRMGEQTLRTAYRSEEFVNLQGIAPSDDGRWLFVADYSRGIFRIDVKNGTIALYPFVDHATLLGIDGLYYNKGRLIAIQNGVYPNRVLGLILSPDATRINSVHILESNNPLFDEPTLGTRMDDQFLFLANSQWSRVGDDGVSQPDSSFFFPLILRLDR